MQYCRGSAVMLSSSVVVVMKCVSGEGEIPFYNSWVLSYLSRTVMTGEQKIVMTLRMNSEQLGNDLMSPSQYTWEVISGRQAIHLCSYWSVTVCSPSSLFRRKLKKRCVLANDSGLIIWKVLCKLTLMYALNKFMKNVLSLLFALCRAANKTWFPSTG